MTSQFTGRLIGGAFGTVFIQANAGALPQHLAVPLRVLAVAGFAGLLVTRRGRTAPGGAVPAPRSGFGRRYWYVVAAEVAFLVAGLLVISRVLHAPHAFVGWIALVVGVHFFGLAAAWRRPALHALGAALTACGAVALVLAALDAPAWLTAITGGIVPGALLLASAWRAPAS
ncbi:hypothetical protein [Streptomyces sp. NRRL S-87]|uniref:hypothetical protein n=1 Tax=Streptomyces sp. NRRL S-87 TaxID=1463920 RepID=UPI001F425BD5|nr:hypothetical protein [Streptomyces sp. NRRL S-87]